MGHDLLRRWTGMQRRRARRARVTEGRDPSGVRSDRYGQRHGVRRSLRSPRGARGRQRSNQRPVVRRGRPVAQDLRRHRGGVRAPDWRLRQGTPRSREPEWSDGYVPLPTTLDPSTVPFWDFNTLMWVGPSDHPCLVWTNAEFSLLGIRTTFDTTRPGNILRGPEGRGLPTPAQLGIEPPADPAWQPIN